MAQVSTHQDDAVPSAELADSSVKSPAMRASLRRAEANANACMRARDDDEMSKETSGGKKVSRPANQLAGVSEKSSRESPTQIGDTVANFEGPHRGGEGNGQLLKGHSAAKVAGLRQTQIEVGRVGGSSKGSKRKVRSGKGTSQKYTSSEDICRRDGDDSSKAVGGEAVQECSELVCRSPELPDAFSGKCADMVPGSQTSANGPERGMAGVAENIPVYVAQSVISDLEKKIALTPLRQASNGHVNGTGGSKKRKRDKRSSAGLSKDDCSGTPEEGTAIDLGSERDTPLNPKKKVRFSLKNNLVWKPNSAPLPPQFMRTPPSATPRGSALKPGLLPGPLYFGKDASEHRRRSARVSPFLRRTRSVSKGLKSGKTGRGRTF
eukprot:TRINITY_DN7598_c0_g2_i1.p1 TRINITY_DN7598_c0_g2~~TRINITY_DN7598_c0_g2_i1.p1  ORF type:complete len:403 (-),score=59.44 TRINITY_DN7598_c0_g2_i1:496-1632(-)